MIRRRDGNENVKNKQTIGLEGKTTILLAHCTFLYIFLPFLHHHDLKLPNLTLHGGRKQDDELSELGYREFNSRRVRLLLTK